MAHTLDPELQAAVGRRWSRKRRREQHPVSAGAMTYPAFPKSKEIACPRHYYSHRAEFVA